MSTTTVKIGKGIFLSNHRRVAATDGQESKVEKEAASNPACSSERRAGQALATDCAKVEGRCVQRRRTVTAAAEAEQRWMDAPRVDGWAGRRPLLVVTWSKSRQLSSLSPQPVPPSQSISKQQSVNAAAAVGEEKGGGGGWRHRPHRSRSGLAVVREER